MHNLAQSWPSAMEPKEKVVKLKVNFTGQYNQFQLYGNLNYVAKKVYACRSGCDSPLIPIPIIVPSWLILSQKMKHKIRKDKGK